MRFFLLLAVLSSTGTMIVMIGAANVAYTHASIGLGTQSCGSWTAYRHNQIAFGAEQYQQWILGFLSGVGFAGPNGFDPLHGVDAEGVWAWIDNYCQAHPLETVEQAGIAFVNAHPH